MKFIGLLLFLFAFFNASSQDLLRYDKMTKNVYQEKEILETKTLFSLMQPQPVPLKHLQASRDSRMFAFPLVLLGSFPLGYTVGYALVAQKIPWVMFGIGAGLMTGGILLYVRSSSQMRKAVDSYNSNISLTSMNHTPFEFSLGFNQNGLGLNFKF